MGGGEREVRTLSTSFFGNGNGVLEFGSDSINPFWNSEGNKESKKKQGFS